MYIPFQKTGKKKRTVNVSQISFKNSFIRSKVDDRAFRQSQRSWWPGLARQSRLGLVLQHSVAHKPERIMGHLAGRGIGLTQARDFGACSGLS